MQNQRFTVKFNNGAWKLFDTVRYEDCEVYNLQKTANAMAILANTLTR